MNILTCKNIEKKYGNGDRSQTVLNGINMSIENGEFISIMGPSGSGKSTLMYALSGMDSIDSGSVTFSDIKLDELSEKENSRLRRTRMGFVFQQPGLLENLNLIDNIMLPAMHNKKKEYGRIAEKARELMRAAGIGELADRRISEVSGGQLQRAGICRALINEPEIIFADEPTGALNSRSSEEIMEILTRLNKKGTAVIIVTHDAKVAAASDRVLFMTDGQIIRERKFSGQETVADRQREIISVMQEEGI